MRCSQCGCSGSVEEFFHTIRFTISYLAHEPSLAVLLACIFACMAAGFISIIAR